MAILSSFGSGIRKSFSGTANFFRGSIQELKKVRWPNRKEMISYTAVVLLLVIALTVFFFILDIGIVQLVQLITRR